VLKRFRGLEVAQTVLQVKHSTYCGVDPATIPSLAAEAAQQWTARFNPRQVNAADFEALYTAACEPRGGGVQGSR